MRICMVAAHCCIRVIKEGLALKSRGYVIELVANRIPFGYDQFESLSVYTGAEMLKQTVRSSNADIFHIHNEPDWMVKAVREATDKPIIFDVHDLASMRTAAEPTKDESDAFAAADAFVYPSKPCYDYAEKQHGEHKHIVLFPYMSHVFNDRNDDRDVSWSSICYEGGLSEDPAPKGQFNLRYIAPIVQTFIKQGYNFHLFPASIMQNNVYENLGAYVAKPAHYPIMLAGLRPFGFGLVGTGASTLLMEAAMPNKLFEYMSQGVVPVIINAGEASKFADEHGIGITLNGRENIKEQLKDGPKIRENILKKRHELTMEKHIQPLIDLYEGLI